MNNAIALEITPRDPLIARDGRPFAAGLRMKSLDWFYPSVLAGSLRTRLGQIAGKFNATELSACEVAGGLPVLHDANPSAQPAAAQLFFPAPADAVAQNTQSGIELYAARPAQPPAGCGCDLHSEFLQPVMLSAALKREFKPASVPRFWSQALIERWLLEPAFDAEGRSVLFKSMPFKDWPTDFLDGPRQDVRMHVQMETKRGVGKDEMLFQSIGLDVAGLRHHVNRKATNCITHNISLSARLRPHTNYGSMARTLDTWGSLGGERRIVHWRSEAALPTGWVCPVGMVLVLRSKPKHIRMTLVTPGLFSTGWLPGWLGRVDNFHEGSPPTAPGLTLRLIGACADRWKPISGWSLEKSSFGAKPVRRLVPAGGVYFFKVVSGDSSLLIQAWMESVCDEPQDRLDGFGLALWGIWRPHS